MYFMKYFVQAVSHVQEITQFCKKQLLTGQFLVGLQVSQHDTQHTFLLKEDNSLKDNSNYSNHFCEGEQVEQSTSTAKQQACEKHSRTNTNKSDGRPVVKLPSNMEPNQLGTSCLSAEQGSHASECKLEQHPEVKIQHHKFMKKHHELDTSVPVKSQVWKKTGYCQPHPAVKKKGSSTRTQIIAGRSAKSTNGTQQHKTKWKPSGGNRLATIQEEPSSVIWRRVPSQSNPADVPSMEIETSIPPTPTTWRKEPHRSLQDPSMCPATRIDAIIDDLNRKWLESIATPLGDNTYSVPRITLYTADPLATAAITRPTGNQSTLIGLPTSEVPPTNSTELQEGYNRCQSSPQMARVQDFLATT
jgi:hypothetical protein